MEKKKEWIEEEAFIKKLYTTFTESSIYELYLTKEEFDYEADREVARKLYKTFVQGNEDFDNLIEDHCIYWNDDKFLIDSFVLKTIKRFTPESTPAQELLPKFSSDEDSELPFSYSAPSLPAPTRPAKLSAPTPATGTSAVWPTWMSLSCRLLWPRYLNSPAFR